MTDDAVEAAEADSARMLAGLTAFMECLRVGHDPIKDSTGQVLGLSFVVPGAISKGLARACRRCRLVYWALEGVDFCETCHGRGRMPTGLGPLPRSECQGCGGSGMKPEDVKP